VLALGLELKNSVVVLRAIVVFYFVKEKKAHTLQLSHFTIIYLLGFFFFLKLLLA
jgi:hypothetical protein